MNALTSKALLKNLKTDQKEVVGLLIGSKLGMVALANLCRRQGLTWSMQTAVLYMAGFST